MWTKGGERRRVVGGELTAPISEALGVPSPLPGVTLDPSVALENGSTMQRETAMLAADEEIFIVAYAVVKRRYSARAGLPRVEKVGPPLRGNAHHLVFSGDEGDEDEDGDDDGERDEGTSTSESKALSGTQTNVNRQTGDIHLDGKVRSS